MRVGDSVRDRDAEIKKLLELDSTEDTEGNKLWLFIPSRWVRKWLMFASLKLSNEEPGRIDMLSLMMSEPSEPLRVRPKYNMKPPVCDAADPNVENSPGHYRRVTKECFAALEELYGIDGYPMAVLGEPYDDPTRWRIFRSTSSIDPKLLPAPIVEDDESKDEKGKKDDSKKNGEKRNKKEEEKGKPNKGGWSLGLF